MRAVQSITILIVVTVLFLGFALVLQSAVDKTLMNADQKMARHLAQMDDEVRAVVLDGGRE